MSYILDALKKSERQRPPGPVPDLFTVQGPQPPASASSRRALATAAILLFGLALGILVWFGSGRRDGDTGRAVVETAQQPARAVPETPPAAERPAPAARAQPARTLAATAAGTTGGPRPRTPVSSARTTRAPISSPGVAGTVWVDPRAQADRPAAAAVLAQPAPSGTPAAVSVPASVGTPSAVGVPAPPKPVEEPVAAKAPVVVPVAEPSAAPTPAPEETPPSDGRVLAMTDLPESLRAQLPKLQVSGHVWSEEPALRLLTVDDRLVHEGNDVAPGVRLQEITADGAIFVCQGWRFRVAGIRP